MVLLKEVECQVCKFEYDEWREIEAAAFGQRLNMARALIEMKCKYPSTLGTKYLGPLTLTLLLVSEV